MGDEFDHWHERTPGSELARNFAHPAARRGTSGGVLAINILNSRLASEMRELEYSSRQSHVAIN